jgi:hypothetical protein
MRYFFNTKGWFFEKTECKWLLLQKSILAYELESKTWEKQKKALKHLHFGVPAKTGEIMFINSLGCARNKKPFLFQKSLVRTADVWNEPDIHNNGKPIPGKLAIGVDGLKMTLEDVADISTNALIGILGKVS